MKKYFSIIILLMFSIVLTACGGGGVRGASGTVSSGSGGGGIAIDDEVTLHLIDEIETKGAPSTVAPYDSLTEASDSGAGSQLFTLEGLVVQGSVITNYTVGDDAFGWTRNSETILSVSRIIFPAVSVSFDDEGRMSAVKAYFADQIYTPVIGRNTPLSDVNLNGGLSGDYDSASLIVDRSKAFFGYDANYMTHVGWRIEQDVRDYTGTNPDILEYSYIITGSMIAGIETRADTLPDSNQDITFMGKGRGLYSEATGDAGDVVVNNSETEFDVNAIVNFGSKSLIVRSSNSCVISKGGLCVSDKNLDFGTPKLYYAIDGVDNRVADISGDVALINDPFVSGVLDAQFYGVYAREFGGTFAMRGQTSKVYYYGAFGAERIEGIASPIKYNPVDVTMVTLPQAKSIAISNAGSAYSTISAVYDDRPYIGERVFTLGGVAVNRDDRTDYVRAPYRGWDTADTEQTVRMLQVMGSAAALTFDEVGNISGVTAYLNGNDYTADGFNAVSDTVVFAPIAEGAGDASVARLVVDRSANLFGFNAPSNYMAYLSWNLAKSASDLSISGKVLNDFTADIGGNMIAGIETDADSIVNATTTAATFTGKGRGSYGSQNKRYATVFDVEAKADFSRQAVVLVIMNSTANDCGADGVCDSLVLTALDFETTLTYQAQTNIFSVANISVAGTLHGRADARFYGPATEEFGGTFALANQSSYYYGAFGAGRGAIVQPVAFETRIRNDILGYETETAINNQISRNPYDSMTEAREAAVLQATSEVLTLNALAGYKHDIFSYVRSSGEEWDKAVITPKVYLATILNPAASLTFNEDGNISAATVYLTDKTYRVNLSASDALSATNFTATTDGVTVTVDRSNDFFGFADSNTPNYIAYLSWDLAKTETSLAADIAELTDSTYNINGGMLAGLQTDATYIPHDITASDRIDFTGKGRGAYGSFDVNGNGDVDEYKTEYTVFDVTAKVDFNNKDVVIDIANTACETANCLNSSTDSSVLNGLNFSTAATPYLGNNISSTVSAGNLTGRLDARFYGGSAWEFGGTFTMLNIQESTPRKDKDDNIIGWRSDSTSYYGVFGAERLTGVDANFVFDAVIKDELVDSETVFTMTGLSTYQNNRTIYRRAFNRDWDTADSARSSSITRLDGAGVSLTFDTSGDIADVTVYADAEYSSANADDNVTADRSEIFGFVDDKGTEDIADDETLTANYMVAISWNLSDEATNENASKLLTDEDKNINGMMLAGIETNNDVIPLTNGTVDKIDFTGKGRGVYADASADSSYKTIFDVTATVDFTSNNVSVSNSGTACTGDCSGVTVPDYLNFSTETLSYRGNNISGAVNADTLAGTLDARFYGDSAREFGGRFALSDADEAGYYYGVFGAERGGINISMFDETLNNTGLSLDERAVLGSKFDDNGTYASLASLAAAGDSLIMRGSSVYQDNSTGYTRAPNRDWSTADTVQASSITRLSDSAASLTFDDDGNISAVTTYLNGRNYTATGTGTDDKSFTGADADTGTELEVDRNSIFGFDSNYMAIISWQRIESANISGVTPSTDLAESDYNASGNMLIGVEVAYGNIRTAGTFDFTGKGLGFYTNINDSNASYETIFDVIANVNFADRNVSITSHNACKNVADANCGVGEADRVDFLNISTASLSYSANNISGAVSAGTLAGTLDARFYGADKAQELGGTFALVDSKGYYYGAFGAQFISDFKPRNTLNFGGLASMAALNPQATNIASDSLTAITDDNVTLQGLAVVLNDKTDYARENGSIDWTDANNLKIDRNISVSRITSSAVNLVFDADGNVAGATVHADDDYTDAVIDRSSDFFGFDSDYMAYISWNSEKTMFGDGIEDSLYTRNGVMLAGIETSNANIFTAGRVEFTGKGKGRYGDITDSEAGYATIFDITANVDFSTNSLAIISSNTCEASDCTNSLLSGLDFSASLTYVGNNISAPVTAGTLAGTLDTRFYGGATQEFGGTFALADSTDYYYGAFGATRNGVTPFVAGDTTTLNAIAIAAAENPQSTDIGTYTSLSAVATAANGGTDIVVTLQGLTVSLNDVTDYARYKDDLWSDSAYLNINRQITPTRIASSAALLTFGSAGTISDATAYADADYSNVTTDRSTVFGFNSSYMAYVTWNEDEAFDASNSSLEQTVTDIDGMMIAGIETATIIDNGTTQFIGKGAGVYGNATQGIYTGYDTVFDVVADVDFGNRLVSLTSTNTCDSSDCANILLPHLDFTGSLSYAESTNAITGTLATMGDTLNPSLTGIADARFYGGAAQEFGGIFLLTDATSYYYGVFGGERGYVTVSETLATDAVIAGAPVPTENRQGLTGFNVAGESLALKTNVALKAATSVQVIKNIDNKTIINSNITGAVANINYDLDSHFSALSFYLDGKKYGTITGFGGEDYLNVPNNFNTVDGTDVTLNKLLLSRGSNAFGFTAEYLARVEWNLDATAAYEGYGYSIIGFETVGADIPSTGTVSFTGKGEGRYYNAITSLRPFFDITANVNFATRNVTLASQNACTNSNDCENTLLPYLDFTGTLTYSAGVNVLTGTDWTTAGDDDNASLTGTADARFYGTGSDAAVELGGTFSLTNSTSGAGYVGWFGAERGYLISSETVATDAVINGANVPTENHQGLTSFHDTARFDNGTPDDTDDDDGKTNVTLEITNMVEITRNTVDKTITNNKVMGAVAEFNYKDNGDFDVSHLYLADRKYTSTSGYTFKDSIRGKINLNDAYSDWHIGLSGGDFTEFGFRPNYMVFVVLADFISSNSPVVSGTIGFETAATSIPTSAASIRFIGNGKSSYYDAARKYNDSVSFAVTADVNFATRMVHLNTTSNGYRDHLNWAGELTYVAGTNAITGNIETKGDADNEKLTGTANATFYGPAAEEFGGTFSLSNATAGYAGWFGLTHPYTASTGETLTTTGAPAEDRKGLTGFNDDARFNYGTPDNTADDVGKIGVTLRTTTAVKITKKDIDKTIMTEKILGVMVQFDYAMNGDFDAFSLYIADKKYSTTDGTGQQDRIYDNSPIADGDNDAPYLIRLSKRSYDFGFAPDYMALVEWEFDRIYGYGITGYETDGGDIPSTGTISFTGKGQGEYYIASSNANLDDTNYFNITANVNFATRNISVTSGNTCIDQNALLGDNCSMANDKAHLDFTGTLTYSAGTNILTGTDWTTAGDDDNAVMTGTADARFYGTNADAATEFGGTFSLTNSSSGYVGWFGTKKPDDVFFTTHADTPTTFNANNLTSFNDSNRVVSGVGTTDNALKAASALEIKLNSDNTITVENFLGAVVEFDYNADGNLGGLTAYFADKKYDVTGGDQTKFYIRDGMPATNDGRTIGWFGLNRDEFGFNANYMARTHWRDMLPVNNNDHYIGYAMVGFETAGNAILITGTAINFTGIGHGAHINNGSINTNYFDVTANVDFATRNISITGEKTCLSKTEFDADNCSGANDKAHLDFKGTLSYAAGVNILTGSDWTTAGSDKDFSALDGTELTGTADARFYGPAVEELGGTFNMSSATVGYIGYFGGERDYIPALDKPTIFNANNLTGFNDSNRNGTSGNALQASNMVEITKQLTGDNAVTTDKILGAVAEFDYKANGDFAELNLYIADKKYSTTTSGLGFQDSVFDSYPIADGMHDDPDFLSLSKGSISFDFTPTYMVRVYWQVLESDYENSGYGMFGWETDGGNIPSTGTAISFTGKGAGYEYKMSSNSSNYSSFTVTANVDFTTRTISLETDNDDNAQDYLNLSGTLNYAAGVNNISGNVETAGNDGDFNVDDTDGSYLSGTADARFYGPAAEELGGTFSLSNANAGYMGYFGVKKPYTISSETVATDAVIGGVNVPAENRKGLTGFNDSNRFAGNVGKTDIALKTTAVEITKHTFNETIITRNITGAVTEFDYASDGIFANGDSLNFYFDNKKYSTSSSADSASIGISDHTPVAVGGDAPSILELYKETSYFGITPEYMAKVNWSVFGTGYVSYGYGITGYETANNAIPLSGRTTFKGQGSGQYYDAGDDDTTYFDVNADVDFGARLVSVTSTNTCTSSSDCANNLLPHLNFTGTLSYTAGINALTGTDWVTAGDTTNNIASLTGTADARFYGGAAQELGGTFSLTNANTGAGYVGYFGAERGYFTSSETVATDAVIAGVTVPTENRQGLIGFNDSVANRKNKTNIALKVNAVETGKNTTDKTIIDRKLNGVIVEISYANDGDFADSGHALYFADNKYSVTNADGELNHISDTTATHHFSLHRNVFGAVTNYLARLHWKDDVSVVDGTSFIGYAIAGFETSDSLITSGGTATFTGAGGGPYTSASTSYTSYFAVTAAVDFSANTVDIASSNSCTVYAQQVAGNCAMANQRNHLNFTGTLSYVAGINNITGAVETAGDATNTELSGTANARFYGPAAEELGGTFSMTNSEASYVGYFGAQQ